MIINHNISALNTHRQLTANNNAVSGSLEKLSSGLKINRAGDDAAGLAISEKMRGQIRGLDMATKNAQDGISLIQTAEGALNETHSILQRMRELAVQSSSDTNTNEDREELQKELDQLSQELSRIGNNTEFNTQNLLGGDFKGVFHIGANEGQNITLEINDMRGNELEVVGAATFGEATTDTVTATYADVDNSGVDTSGGDTEAIATIVNGTYTVESDGSSGFNLVNGSGDTVATSTNGTTFTGVDGNDGTADSIVFGSALEVGASVEIDTSGSNATVTSATLTDTKISGHSLEAGNYKIDGSDLKNSSDEIVGTFSASDGGYVVDDKVVLASATEIADGTEISVGGLDISSQTAANSAITTINDAIETVSAERSKLGAVQNRLEHTINNLGASSENLSAAESRIRDVDMAKEMMEFTKNNILTQAAQAMLAQANQTPQGVLQLLR